MTMLAKVLLILAAATGSAQAHDDAVNCDNCGDWNKPVKPFNVYGNTWYVGVKGLSVMLVHQPRRPYFCSMAGYRNQRRWSQQTSRR